MTEFEARKREEVARLLREQARRLACPFRSYFPEVGPLRRQLYPRSMQFIGAGAEYKERLFLGANRVSKTVTAAYEATAHALGEYPPWWEGHRFEGPISIWAAGDTHETTRDIMQAELFGPRDAMRLGRWNGMVPAERVLDRTLMSGVADCIDTVWIRHKERDHGAPCTSTLQFKAYASGRLSFQGTSIHVVWMDEEPPDARDAPTAGGAPSGNGDIYTECLLRTATTEGIVMVTLTPLRGLTPFLSQFLETADMVDAEGRIVNAKQQIFGEAA